MEIVKEKRDAALRFRLHPKIRLPIINAGFLSKHNQDQALGSIGSH